MKREIDWNLIAHVREQIGRSPELYANPAKLKIVAEKIEAELHDRHDDPGAAEV